MKNALILSLILLAGISLASCQTTVPATRDAKTDELLTQTKEPPSAERISEDIREPQEGFKQETNQAL